MLAGSGMEGGAETAGAFFGVAAAEAIAVIVNEMHRDPAGEEDMQFIRKLAGSGVLALLAPVFHHRDHFRLALTGGAQMLEGGVSVLRRLGAR